MTTTRRKSVMNDGRSDFAPLSNLYLQFKALLDRMSCFVLVSAGLAIKAGGSVLVKTGASVCTGFVSKSGVPTGFIIAAATDMPTLPVTPITNAKHNVYVFLQKSDGTRAVLIGVEGATRAAIVFPDVPDEATVLGILFINPTGAGNFVGNTTAIDDAGVVPNAVFSNLAQGVLWDRSKFDIDIL